MTDGEIRSGFVTWAQVMIDQAQVVATQAQDMAAQANRKVVPHVQQIASTTISDLRDITRMNPHIFYGSKVNEHPQDFTDEVYKIL